VGRKDISGLYALEWKRAKEKLVADHREAIEREPRRWRRFLRTSNAVLFGLSKRLAPARRVLFGAALLSVLLSMQGPMFVHDSETTREGVRRTVEYSFHFDNGWLFIALTLVTLLLAMELVDKINYRDELELARELQATLIPRVLPTLPGYELGAWNRIANMVGGDIYDFVPLPDGRLAVLFGDASGHGMAAGLVMAVAHAAFRTQLETDPLPPAMFGTLNRILCRTGGPRAFFGCAYLLLAPDGSFSISVAGHPPVFLVGRDGGVLERFGKGAYPLGIRPSLSWPVETGCVGNGQIVLFYSDGLSEARNASWVEFGDVRLESSLLRLSALAAPDLVSALATEVRAYTGDAAPEDDISIAAIRRAG
jgi:serine phosphatase RsbU (regulator of sigma subunit)